MTSAPATGRIVGFGVDGTTVGRGVGPGAVDGSEDAGGDVVVTEPDGTSPEPATPLPGGVAPVASGWLAVEPGPPTQAANAKMRPTAMARPAAERRGFASRGAVALAKQSSARG